MTRNTTEAPLTANPLAFNVVLTTTKLAASKAARAAKPAPKSRKGTKLAASKAARKATPTKAPTWFKGSQRKVTVERIVAALKGEAMTVKELAKKLKVSHTGAQNYIAVARKQVKVKLAKGSMRQGSRGPKAFTFQVA